MFGFQICGGNKMNITKKTLTLLTVCLLLFSAFAVISRIFITTAQSSGAELMGIAGDSGKDTDGDGKYNYLEVAVEINVSVAGNYRIEAYYLEDQYGAWLYLFTYNESYLDLGAQLLNLSFYGPAIYAASFNAEKIQWIDLYDEYHDFLGEIIPVQLSKIYNYTDFDCAGALTRNIIDRGVDEDDDGLFDYLEVGVEVNITEAGSYRISVDGLTEQNNATKTIYDYHYFEVDLDKNVHVINFTFPGPMIAYHHLNPTNITGLRLVECAYYYELGYIDMAALSTRYKYIQFNPPFQDMEIQFMVYPNATIDVSGNFSHTHIYPPQYGPLFNATIDFSTSSDTTTGSVNGTMMPPERERSEWPLNSTVVEFLAEYYNNMLNAQLNATLFMPPVASAICPLNSSSGDFTLIADYLNGLVGIDLFGTAQMCPEFASEFPFNITDFTIYADYVDNEIKGNITFHTLAGFPLSDVIVDFAGNKTEFSFTGYIEVLYGNYFGMEINATTLEEMLVEFNNTIPGHGGGSLYNMTDGMIECTVLNTTKTPLDSYGARVDYNATIRGNFTQLLARYATEMLFGPSAPEEAYSLVYAALNATLSSVRNASLQLNYWHLTNTASIHLSLISDVKALWSEALQLVPPTVPEEYRTQCEAWLKIANTTACAIENAHIEAIYSGDQQKLNLSASLAANITQLEDDVIPFIPDSVPLELKEIFESYLDVTYCELDSLTASLNYTYGAVEFEANWGLEGDFKAQINHGKSFIINFLNATDPTMNEWQMRFFNATEIDISNFTATIGQGEDWMTLAFKGLKMYPVKDEIDFIRFKLHEWLNMTSDPQAPPKEFEKLKIVMACGFNGTHTVLLYAPGTAPSPNVTSLDYKIMTWENVTMSGLKDLLFKIAYQGIIDHLGKTYYVPIFTNSTMSHFDFNSGAKCIRFNVTGATGTGFCNVTIPRALLYAMPEWDVSIDGEPVGFNVTENGEYVFIYLNYTHSSHLIEIKGTWIITEFPPNMLPLILMIISLIAAIIAVKQRKKLDTLKTKYQSVIQSFANRLYKLRT
jgi:hypothetical protein